MAPNSTPTLIRARYSRSYMTKQIKYSILSGRKGRKMTYNNIINKELRIAAVGINELSAKHAVHFLAQWEEGAKLGELTLFFDTESGDLVLNKDNPQYQMYLEIAETYLQSSSEVQQELKEQAPKGIEETMEVLENCVRTRTAKKEISIALKNRIEEKYRIVLRQIERENPSLVAAYTAFRYGMICGKRAERARRKK